MTDTIELSHPELPPPAPGELREVRVQSPDPLWDLRVGLPGPAMSLLPSVPAPAPGARMHLLAAYRGADLPFEVEIFGRWLEREIDPDALLHFWVRDAGHLEVLSARSIPQPGGRIGDCLARLALGRRALVRRVLARKWGPRLLMAIVQAPEDRYPALADRIALSLSSLAVAHDIMGPHAEPMTPLRGELPVPWRAALPASWTVLEAPDARGGAGLAASPRAAPVDGTPSLDVRVLPRAAAQTAREAVRHALRTWSADLETPVDLESVPAPAPLRAFRGEATVLFHGWRSRLLCRVCWHNRAWVVVSGVGREGRDEEGAALAFRGVDVVAESLVVEG